MKIEVVSMKITDDNDSEYSISTEDDNGELSDGYFRVTDTDGDVIHVTEPVLRALVRAAEAFATGVLHD